MTGEITGRDAELSVVQAFLDYSVEGLRALVLEGEAGIGKSTLWLAGVAAARERSFRVLISRPAETERTLANVVLGDLFGDAPPDVLATLPAPRRHAFESALLMRDAPDLPVDPRALGVAIVTLLPVVADGGPLVLAIDDDQWMDPSSAATLGFALRRLLRPPVLLLLSRRVGGAAGTATALEDVVDPAEVERLRVGPLSVGAIQVLLRGRLGISFPRPVLLRLHEVSGGNPFYALELARAQSADGARDATLPLVVPPSLERLVGARLGVLDPPTLHALLLIAAHGRLPVGLLRPLGVAPEVLDRPLASHVIETSGEVLYFNHPLLASAVYQGASGDDRRAAHRHLSMAFDDPVQRGRHQALGADEPDDELAAALESAANTARDRGMPIAAAELAEHALRLTPPGAHDDRRRRAFATARAHSAAGEGDRARAIASDLVVAATAGRQRAEALVLRSELERPDIALTVLGDALAQSAGAAELEAAVHARLAEAGRLTKGGAWAEPHAQASLRLAERLDDDALRATALALLALLRFERGDGHALELAERAYRIAARRADPRQMGWVGWMVGDILTCSGSIERAREWLQRQLADWGERDELVRWELLYYLALAEFWSGNWTIASERTGQHLEIGVQYGRETPQSQFPPALIALHRGQFADARDASQRAVSLAGGQLAGAALAVLGICDLWSGNPAAALAYLAQAEQTADNRGWDEPFLRWWRAEYVEALLQLGRVDDATRLVADWEAAAERLGRERVLAQAVRCRGLIAAAHGDLPAALDLLEEAADRHEAVGDPFGRARALLALGVVRRRARQKRTARAALEDALAGFEALGAASWAATVRRELGRIGGRTRIVGLSASELSVAALVAEGRTNREIASALFLGESTVASHLTHIYSKLGIRSRTELARQELPMGPLSSGGTSKIHPS
jgi:DNA-binding CsgD family transcriptional regulator